MFLYSNVIVGMKTLIEAFEDEKVSIPDDLDISVAKSEAWKSLASFDEDDFVAQRDDVCVAIQQVWTDKGIQYAWESRAKFQIQDSVEHFFEAIGRITEPDYLPSDKDVLLARIRTTGIVEQTFVIKQNKFQVFDVGGQRNERKKWIHCFEKVTGVIFLAALSAYDQTLYEDDQTNRMKEALDLFKQICNSRLLKETAMILFLNKKDLFKSKIQGTPLSVCFPDCGKGVEHDELEAREYIKKQFVKLNHPIKAPNGKSKKKPLFCHYTCAIDRNQVEKIFRDVQNVIIHANLEKAALI